jgi:sterol desaturase/sphingolipid hydroxylase (fatty acid hydroxylase superfamily)
MTDLSHAVQWIEHLLAPLGPDVNWLQVMLVGMTPLFLIGFAIECRVQRRRGRPRNFEWRDVIANINLGGAYQLFELLAHALVVGAAVNWFWRHRLFDIPVNGWTLGPLFVLQEFCYYWFHRTSHTVRWFWSAHVVHHSEERMNMSTAMRQSLLYVVTGWWLFFMPMVLLGVPPAVVFILYGCNLSYQFFIHTESVGKLHPWIEYVFDTPSHHRVHHGRNPQYLDKNFGGVLIVFDRWFGTYAEEIEPVEYGIVHPIHSRNLLVLNFHEFLSMWRDALRPGPLGQRLKHLWMPPDWTRH